MTSVRNVIKEAGRHGKVVAKKVLTTTPSIAIAHKRYSLDTRGLIGALLSALFYSTDQLYETSYLLTYSKLFHPLLNKKKSRLSGDAADYSTHMFCSFLYFSFSSGVTLASTLFLSCWPFFFVFFEVSPCVFWLC